LSTNLSSKRVTSELGYITLSRMSETLRFAGWAPLKMRRILYYALVRLKDFIKGVSLPSNMLAVCMMLTVMNSSGGVLMSVTI
jgi:hypothetical protein